MQLPERICEGLGLQARGNEAEDERAGREGSIVTAVDENEKEAFVIEEKDRVIYLGQRWKHKTMSNEKPCVLNNTPSNGAEGFELNPLPSEGLLTETQLRADYSPMDYSLGEKP